MKKSVGRACLVILALTLSRPQARGALRYPGIEDYGGPPIVLQVLSLTDLDGDLDSFPDTGETAEVRVALSNKSATTYHGVTGAVFAIDGKLARITTSFAVGLLPAHSEVTVALPLVFQVHAFAERGGAAVTCNAGVCSNLYRRAGVHGASAPCVADSDCRRAPEQSYAGGLEILLSSEEAAPLGPTLLIPIELDLNVAHASVPTTTFSQGFESGLAPFTFMPLDTAKGSNALSDGYRCQKNDPDYANSNSYGDTECYLGFGSGSSSLNANDWHIHTTAAPDGGRARSGSRSLHYGRHVVDGLVTHDTTALSQLDAVRSSGIALAARICAADPAPDPRACSTAADCVGVGGGACVSARPTLSFSHQVSGLDARAVGFPAGQSGDRAVVQARALPSGAWQNVPAFHNVYDAEGEDTLSNCTFDPIDDDSTEDQWFPGTLYFQPAGPSSTCDGARVFAYLGDTDEAFDSAKIGRASDGPGLPGSLGPGTWVESRFDLSGFRGRTIQLRFLYTTIKISDSGTYEDVFRWNPTPFDDGWYIDDIRVTQSLGAVAPTATLDAALPPAAADADLDGVADAYDNCPGLANVAQQDTDRDGAGDPCDADDDGDGVNDAGDCAPADERFSAVPGDVSDLKLSKTSGGFTQLNWSAPPSGGSYFWYSVERGPEPALYTSCLGRFGGRGLIETGIPAAGSAFFYLVTATNLCGENAGTDSSGIPRAPAACP